MEVITLNVYSAAYINFLLKRAEYSTHLRKTLKKKNFLPEQLAQNKMQQLLTKVKKPEFCGSEFLSYGQKPKVCGSPPLTFS